MVFQVVMYGCENWTVKKVERWGIDVFELWCWRRLFFFSFIFISWRRITLQYCSGFCHTLTWMSHGFTCIPHWESLGLQGDPTSPSWRRSVLGVHWKDWCWSWNSYTLATSCKELTHWKRPSCWEGLGAGGERDDRGWDVWMASPTRWTWVWVNSRSWWWTGRPGMLRFMGSQIVGHNWATELNWTGLSHLIGYLPEKFRKRFSL